MKLVENTDRPEALDARWFPHIAAIHEGVPARLAIKGYNHTRAAFIAGQIKNPVFRYGNNHDERAEEKRRALRSLQGEMENDQDTHPIVKHLYKEKITEKLQLLELVRLSHTLTDSGQQASEAVAQDYKRVSEAVFGPVDQEVFIQACAALEKKLGSVPASIKVETAKAEILAILGKVSQQPVTIPPFSVNVTHTAEEPITDQTIVRRAFKEAFREAGLDNWRVVRGNRTRTGFVVKAGSRTIVVPNQTTLNSRRLGSELSSKRLEALIQHELTHAVRYERGKGSRLQLLAVGLPRYLRGEEGYATYRQQMIIGADDYSGAALYLAGGLATGLDRGGEPRDFREVYEILLKYYTVLAVSHEMDPALVAFKVCSTLFKGTHGNHPGVFLTLQTCYREGNIRVHQAMQENPAWQKYALIGKYDFTNPAHVAALQELGILPEVIE